jgi:hypothetical protein
VVRQKPRVLRLLLLTLFLLVISTAITGALRQPPRPAHAASTYADSSQQAITNLLQDFYSDGRWKACLSGCTSHNTDWGADALTYTLFLRWTIHGHDPSVVTYLNRLSTTAPTWQPPCHVLAGCHQPWSDQPLWDAVALSREYEATGLTNAAILSKAQAAFNVVDGADPSVYLFGACPSIPYQQPGGGASQLKTLETASTYIKAALLLYGSTNNASYLTKARAAYATVRRYFLDPTLPLYTVYVFDNGTSCRQVPGRFFASVNGNMIDNGLRLAQATGEQSYRDDALATAQAVADHLSDASGVYANLQAENDIAEPLIEAMYAVATDEHQAFARTWLLAAASASASALKPDGAYSRFFDGPPQVGTSSAWQANGGYALAVAAAGLDPSGTPTTTAAWTNATSHPSSITTTTLPASITFMGTGIALIGTLGEHCCKAGHARVFIDGTETVDTTGIWQNKSSAGISIPHTVLFAWRWPTEGLHTLQIQPGIANAKEGGSFIDISSYLVTP